MISAMVSSLFAMVETLGSLYRVFTRQRIKPALLIGVAIFALAWIFVFLSFTPILSPFVYPLF